MNIIHIMLKFCGIHVFILYTRGIYFLLVAGICCIAGPFSVSRVQRFLHFSILIDTVLSILVLLTWKKIVLSY